MPKNYKPLLPPAELEDLYNSYPKKGLTITAYAKHRKEVGIAGTQYTAIKQALDSGKIHFITGTRKINPKDADASWGVSVQQNGSVDHSPVNTKSNGGNMPLDVPLPEGEIPSYTVSHARREHLKAQYDALELAKLRGLLVERDAIDKQLYTIARQFRDTLLAIPVRVCTIYASETSSQKIENSLVTEIESSLERLANNLTEIVGVTDDE